MMALFDPDRYHGHNKKARFFEGWYFKVVDPTHKQRLAIIPGVYMSPDGANRFAFVMVVDGSRRVVAFSRYSMEDFQASRNKFEVQVGPNRFSADRVELSIAEKEISLDGSLQFEGRKPWPVTLAAPGIMGWYGYVPFMECFHGVVSLDHSIQGTLTINGEEADFSGGRGYIEKDWGRNFPSSWVWMQGNHFDTEGVCLSASMATIPFLGRHFPGNIIGLLLPDKLYRFATYTGARITQLSIHDTHVELQVIDKHHQLDVVADRGPTALLFAPGPDDMEPTVRESLESSLEVRLMERGPSPRTLFHETCPYGALEVQKPADLLNMLAKQWASS